MIHTNRIVTVGEQESIIDRPIVLYRGDREVEIEFTLVGNEFTFSEEGNVIKSVNASHGQLVLNTPSGEHMFSELAECHEGKVVFVVTKEMIDELIEVGFYNFQIRLYDSVQMKSRVTIPPVLQGFDIRNPIAAEDETNVSDLGIVDYSRVGKDEWEDDLPTFDWQGNYNKTEWKHHDVIYTNKLNKIEDALYSINANVKESDVVMLNTLDKVKKDADKYVKEHMTEVEQDVEEFERNLNSDVQKFKVDTNAAMTTHKNEVSEVVDGFSVEIESNNSQLEHIKNGTMYNNIVDFGASVDNDDNKNNIQNAIDDCIARKRNLYIPEGTYMTTPGLNCEGLDFDFKIFGEGKLKIKDNCITKNGQRLFMIRNKSGSKIRVEVDGISIDMNARNNPLPSDEDEWLWQHNHAFTFFPTDEWNMSVCCNNLDLFDLLADGISLSGTSTTFDKILISNITSDGRTRVRSDITITGQFNSASITNVSVEKIESEINVPKGNKYSFVLSNFSTKVLDLHFGGKEGNAQISNGIVTEMCSIWNCNTSFSNINFFNILEAIRISNSNVTFSDCRLHFNIEINSGYGAIYQIGSDNTNLICNNCDFAISENTKGNAKAFIYKEMASTNLGQLVFKNCTFDNNIQAIIFRNGYLSVENCIFNFNGINIEQGATTGSSSVDNMVILRNNICLNGGKLYKPTDYRDSINIYMSNNICDLGNSLILTRVDKIGTLWKFKTLDSYISSSQPTTGYYVYGQKVYNDFSVDKESIGWICTGSGNPGTWKVF